ncbi:MAG: hypothetical protein FJX36_12345 [Alphaproteobacteria bacterium]|nr:hypothetical protein [Alphaproteobacteria bacterium]
MGKVELRYDRLMDDAVRGVIAKVLGIAARQGLSGQHHFLITFRTGHPGVDIADELRARYPQDMTIILQNQFWNLKVADARFSVTLSFNKVPQHLVIPYGAIVGFADPSVKWGIKLEPREAGAKDAPAPAGSEPAAPLPAPETRVPTVARDAEPDGSDAPSKVVTLDAFRRK